MMNLIDKWKKQDEINKAVVRVVNLQNEFDRETVKIVDTQFKIDILLFVMVLALSIEILVFR